MRQRDPEFGARHDAETIAGVTGLALKDMDTSVPIESVSTGLSYTIVPIKSLAALQNLRIDLHAGTISTEERRQILFIFVFARNP